jgi:apolipoprotein N-acyltransferase
MTVTAASMPQSQGLGWRLHLIWATVALLSFHAAHSFGLGWLLILSACALIEISRAATARKVVYPMLALGFLFYAPQLGFFWGIFGPAAIVLWLVLGAWIPLFGLALRLVRLRLGWCWALALAPFIWTGLEYFRCELYYLRFGWLTFGMSNHATPSLSAGMGVFAYGFLCFTVAAMALALPKRWKTAGMIILACSAAMLLFGNGIITQVRSYTLSADNRSLPVAGVQLEFPDEQRVLSALNQARAKFPETQLFMLSEYTFLEPVPQRVRDWCASNRVWLVVGGKEPLGDTNFYNMAYVVGTNGAIVHRQVKNVPIQFFKDGLPAPDRRVWDSPWGRVGILTCYDLSYTRVVDDFVRQGAIVLLNPTMDVSDWGEGEHRLHSYVAPMRAAEYGIPIFRIASSGVSQLVDRTGQVVTAAPFPGEDAIVGGKLPLNARPRLPLDRWLAPFCVVITALAFVVAMVPRKIFNVHSRLVVVNNPDPC